MPTEPFDLRAVEQAIADTEFAGHLHHLATIPSTNDLALEATQSGARHGVWIADEQTAGRGRGSHTWHSAAGAPLEPAGLYMTALIAPPIPMQSALSLSLTTAIAVQSAICVRLRFPPSRPDRHPLAQRPPPQRHESAAASSSTPPPTPPRPRSPRPSATPSSASASTSTTPPFRPNSTPSPPRSAANCPTRRSPLRREPLAAAILLALDDEIRRTRQLDNLATCNLNLGPHPIQLLDLRQARPRRSARRRSRRLYWHYRRPRPHGFLLVNGDDGQLHTVLSGGLREP